LLKKFAVGNTQASKQLFALVYDDLKKCARNYMRKERGTHTLQATALVHEAYIRLVEQQKKPVNRDEFLAFAATVMRHILVDHARRRLAFKRDHSKVPLEDDILPLSVQQSSQLIALDDALEALKKHSPRLSRVIELRYFSGFTQEEVAAMLRVSAKTVGRDWQFARAWLSEYIEASKA
jgi:RNA polymerase sigma-70 factor, ECF subfamily